MRASSIRRYQGWPIPDCLAGEQRSPLGKPGSLCPADNLGALHSYGALRCLGWRGSVPTSVLTHSASQRVITLHGSPARKSPMTGFAQSPPVPHTNEAARLNSELARELAAARQQLAAQQEELTQQGEQLAQMQKLAAIGELASTTTHEFNNILMTVLNYARPCRASAHPCAASPAGHS